MSEWSRMTPERRAKKLAATNRRRRERRESDPSYRERQNELRRIWGLKNPEKVKALNAKNYYRTPEVGRRASRVYYQKHKKERAAYNKQYLNKPDMLEYKKAYQKLRKDLLKTCPHCNGAVPMAAWKQRIENDRLQQQSSAVSRTPRTTKSGNRASKRRAKGSRVTRPPSATRRPAASAKRGHKRAQSIRPKRGKRKIAK